MASFTSDDPTFQGLLASLRQAQGAGQPEPPHAAAAVAGPSSQPGTAVQGSVGSAGAYTVPYELPPAVDGVYPTYASLEQGRSGSIPTDPLSRSADAYSPSSFEPLPSATNFYPSPDSRAAQHIDPFATTSTGGQKPKDLRLLSFTQALPYLTRLAEDPTFIALLRQLKEDQDALERRLYDQRKQMIARHKQEVEKAELKASVTGQGKLTEFQKKDLAASLATALVTFNQQQVIPTWDYLAKTQLGKLEARGVPGLGTSQTERESELGSNRLRKILRMLEGVLEDSRCVSPLPPPLLEPPERQLQSRLLPSLDRSSPTSPTLSRSSSPPGPNFSNHRSSGSPSPSLVSNSLPRPIEGASGGFHPSPVRFSSPPPFASSDDASLEGVPARLRASSSSPRPILQRNKAVTPSPATPPPSSVAFPRALPPSPEHQTTASPMPYGTPARRHPALLRSDDDAHFNAGPACSYLDSPRPYESPYIPPPTPTSPLGTDPYDGIEWVAPAYDGTASPQTPLSPLSTPLFKSDGAAEPKDSAPPLHANEHGSSTAAPLVVGASDSAAFLPALLSIVSAQPASFPMDQRSSDLTTISEETSSRYSTSTRSNSIATVSIVGSAGLAGLGSRRGSIGNGVWETVDGTGLRRPLGGEAADTAKSTGSGGLDSPVDKRSLGPPERPSGQPYDTSPMQSFESLVPSPAAAAPRRLSPAEQIVALEIRRSPPQLTSPAPSDSEPTSPSLLARRSLAPGSDHPVRPPRNPQRPLSFTGSPTALAQAFPPTTAVDDHHSSPRERQRTTSVGSGKRLPPLPSPPVLPQQQQSSPARAAESTTIVRPLRRASRRRVPARSPSPSSASSSSVSLALTDVGADAHATRAPSNLGLAQTATQLGACADDLAIHAQALGRLSAVGAQANDDDDLSSASQALDAALVLLQNGSTVVSLALDVGRRALERVREGAEEVLAGRERLERERQAWEEERGRWEAEKRAEELTHAGVEKAGLSAALGAGEQTSVDGALSPTLPSSVDFPTRPDSSPNGRLAPVDPRSQASSSGASALTPMPKSMPPPKVKANGSTASSMSFGWRLFGGSSTSLARSTAPVEGDPPAPSTVASQSNLDSAPALDVPSAEVSVGQAVVEAAPSGAGEDKGKTAAAAARRSQRRWGLKRKGNKARDV